ncbi:DUF1697 domain-containing protein [Novosphingobium sp. Gsoil 351]|uniref:DUF1697 domain-containing protein n=1 Tax=Novosphingobium sp. Gsoil 351 TaxID=2675225 RepID=UPI0012B47CE3|nr:DUF1697 domain-containing protein [Novosphingobium sp. Gsoil 351]QGN55422.1 DUF1697 domain-containing protein [Novosphingobium sp. Gsoil 351]
MPRYVAFLGSINVGGNRLSMADLRAAFEAEDLERVETVVASGNVLFDFPQRPTPGLEEKLGLMMRDRFEMEGAVCVRDRAEVAAAISDNPFAGVGEDKLVHTHFLERPADADQFAVLVADHAGRGPEKVALGDRALFIDYVDGVGDSRLTGKFLERRLGCRGTARNIRSLARILAKMDEA